MAYPANRQPRAGDACTFDNGVRLTVLEVSTGGRHGYQTVDYRLADGRYGQLFASEFSWGATPIETPRARS